MVEKEGILEFNYYPNCSADSTATPFDWDFKINKYLENYKERVCENMAIAKIVPKFLRKKVVTAALKRIYNPQKVECKIRTLSDIIKENNIQIIGELPFDTSIPKAMVQSKPVTEFSPNSPASNEIKKLWEKLQKILFD